MYVCPCDLAMNQVLIRIFEIVVDMRQPALSRIRPPMPSGACTELLVSSYDLYSGFNNIRTGPAAHFK